MKKWIGVALVSFLFFGSGPAGAQEKSEANLPPEVLTSDLTLKTLLESKNLEVTFVIVDSDNVAEVSINGEAQQFEPSDTVMITKNLEFTEDVTNVTVFVKDQEGNSRTVTYTVFLPGVDPDVVAAKRRKAGLNWYVIYNAAVENDDNPSQDLSAPFDYGGLKLDGVVDEQEDTRQRLMVMGGINFGPWSAALAVYRITYDTAKIAEDFDVEINMLGLGYRKAEGGFEIGYVFNDINLGSAGNDYALTHTLSPGWRVHEKEEDGTSQTLWGVDIILKDFAASEDLQKDTTVFTAKWDYRSVDAAKQDTYRRLIILGTASEGDDEQDFSFAGIAFNWNLKWDSGWLWNLGTGLHFRNYSNDEASTDAFGTDTRLDIPMFFATGLGYEILPSIRVLLNMNYTFDLSNKSPYERLIFGLGVNGRF